MDQREFARIASSWIAPLQILSALQRYEHNPSNLTTQASTVLCSTVIQSADEAGLKAVIEKFLVNFFIPDEILEFLPPLVGSVFTGETVNWLRRLRFEGTVEALNGRIRDNNTIELLAIHEREVFIDLSLQPLRMLTHFVSSYARHWKQIRGQGVGWVFLEHSANGPFAVEIESMVAQAYGHSAAGAAMQIPNAGIKRDYRSVTLVLRDAPNANLIAAAQDAAKTDAISTTNPR